MIFKSRFYPFTQADIRFCSALDQIFVAKEAAGIAGYGTICKVVPQTGGELALHCRQPGSQHCLGREEGQQENQGIPEQFAGTNKKIAEVYQKVLYCIHAAKIIKLVACSKFT